MQRVLKALEQVRRSGHAESVHDLRVAMRRCRSIASIFEEVDGHRAWHRIRRRLRPLFRASGLLRDLHVKRDWVKTLVAADAPLRARLLDAVDDEERAPQAAVRRALDAFDRVEWRRLARVLARRFHLLPPNGLAAECLVFERYEGLRSLQARAIRLHSPQPWHALRVGLKRFRYSAEALLPERAASWKAGLAELQDLLGEVHDLDELASWTRSQAAGASRDEILALRRAIASARDLRLDRYRGLAGGQKGRLAVWAEGLPKGPRIRLAAEARVRTMVRAMDPNPRRTASIARLATALLKALRRAEVDARLHDARLSRVLQASAALHGISIPGRRKPRHKAARDFLLTRPVPPLWSSDDWALTAEVVRYSRGAEPSAHHCSFARLSSKRRGEVRALAGILRLARALHRWGASLEPDAVVPGAGCLHLRVVGVPNTAGASARLAHRKHLLQSFLGRPLHVDTASADLPPATEPSGVRSIGRPASA
jgi:CHAD domain-containing protein